MRKGFLWFEVGQRHLVERKDQRLGAEVAASSSAKPFAAAAKNHSHRHQSSQRPSIHRFLPRPVSRSLGRFHRWDNERAEQQMSAFHPKRPLSLNLSRLRVTPAMQLGIMDHVWTINELVDVAFFGVVTDEPRGRKVGRFSVIDGGRKDCGNR